MRQLKRVKTGCLVTFIGGENESVYLCFEKSCCFFFVFFAFVFQLITLLISVSFEKSFSNPFTSWDILAVYVWMPPVMIVRRCVCARNWILAKRPLDFLKPTLLKTRFFFIFHFFAALILISIVICHGNLRPVTAQPVVIRRSCPYRHVMLYYLSV